MQLPQAIRGVLAPDTPLATAENLNRDVLEKFYTLREHHAAWVDDHGVLTPAGVYLLTVLEHVEGDAIDPKPLHRDALQRLRAVLMPDVPSLAAMDVMLSDAALRYHAALQVSGEDPVNALQTALAENRVEEFLASLPPTHADYRKLKAALTRYQSLAASGGWPSVPTGPNLSKGMTGPQLPVLRRRLIIEGDYPELSSPMPKQRERRMEPELVEALKRFQARNGLRASGKLDEATRVALNVPVTKRVDQIRANLVRWRSMPHEMGTRYLLVNVLTYSVHALENGVQRFGLRAIVGRPERPTPSLASDVSAIIFNPTWHVPTKLATEDLAPKQLKDPSFFSKQKIHVFSGRGNQAVEIDPSRINWTQVGGTKFPYLLRQDPGPDNSLGHIKFAFPNSFDVYLHDTPNRALFGKTDRALSSGCVRVDQPMKLALYLLDGQPGTEWTEEKIKETIATGKRKTVRLAHPMRIYLVYWTAWVDEVDQLHFRDDIYGLDTGAKPCIDNVCITQRTPATGH